MWFAGVVNTAELVGGAAGKAKDRDRAADGYWAGQTLTILGEDWNGTPWLQNSVNPHPLYQPSDLLRCTTVGERFKIVGYRSAGDAGGGFWLQWEDAGGKRVWLLYWKTEAGKLYSRVG